MADEQVAVAPETTQQTTPQTNVQVDTPAPVQTQPEATTEDILSKVTKKQSAPQDNGGTFKEFDDITDPALRQRMIEREKQRQADYTRKTQEVAREREEVQKQLTEMQNWTPEKVQKYLLNNPSFLQAAQAVASQPQNPAGSGLTDEQFSALTPAEKNQLFQMSGEIQKLKEQNFMSALSQKDALLQTKYGDYDALKVNQGIQQLASMNPIDIREHAYKAIFHDDHVKAAYEMGRKEALGLNQTRTQGVTTPNVNLSLPSNDRPKREKGETDMAYFQKLANFRIEQSRNQSSSVRK